MQRVTHQHHIAKVGRQVLKVSRSESLCKVHKNNLKKYPRNTNVNRPVCCGFHVFSRGSTLVSLAVATAKRERQRCQQQQHMENCNLYIRPNLNTIYGCIYIYTYYISYIHPNFLPLLLPSLLNYLPLLLLLLYSYSDYSYYCRHHHHHHHSYYQLSTTYLRITTWLPNHLTTYYLTADYLPPPPPPPTTSYYCKYLQNYFYYRCATTSFYYFPLDYTVTIVATATTTTIAK